MSRLALLLALGVALFPAKAADARPDRAQPEIVNGLLTSDHPTTGALLFGNDPDTATSWCSGTLIGCGTFLTAAHCVCEFDGATCTGVRPPDPADFLVFLQHAGFFPLASISLRSDYSFPVADVAVLELAVPTTGVPVTPLNETSSPPFGSPGTIVGFGRSGGSSLDYGLKRAGSVVTAACRGGISNTTSVCWEFDLPLGPPGDDSNTCNADSGGPLFIDLGAGSSVAGVTSGGDAFDCLPPDRSFDANVFFYRSWIQLAGGSDVGNAECGELPRVGDPGAVVHGFSGSVSAAAPEGRHSFPVPAGASLVRVSMNASEEGSNDFDLYVKAGSPPSTTDYDCRAFGANQWGFCEFASPAETTWHVLVHRYAGSGEYQATATVFVPECADGLDNDGDGLSDFPDDPGCDSVADPSESSMLLACDDGADNDGDGLSDYPEDPGCAHPGSPRENPECQDGLNNDPGEDALVDFDGGASAGRPPGEVTDPDPQCVGKPWSHREAHARCGLGHELVAVLPALIWLFRVRRRGRVPRRAIPGAEEA